MHSAGLSALDSARRTIETLHATCVGMIERSVAARFRVASGDLWLRRKWPAPAAKARDTAIYVMVTDLEMSCERAGAHFGMTERTVRRAVQRVVDERDADYALDNWLTELSADMRRRRP